MAEIWALILAYRVLVIAIVMTFSLILLIMKFWDKIKFWWLCMWTSFPVFGTIAKNYKSKTIDANGWFNSEKTICSKFYSFYGEYSGKNVEFYKNCALYLEKAQETGRSTTPIFIWILIIGLVVAESLGFAYVLAGYTLPGASESLQQKGAIGISLVISTLLVALTHATGGEIYKNSVVKKIREWWRNDDSRAKSRLKPDDCEINLEIENNILDNDKPKYQKLLNRVNTNANVTTKWYISIVTGIFIVAIAIGATYVRGQVLEKQLNQEISSISVNAYDTTPSELSDIQMDADKKALEEQQSADRKGGWATFIVLAVLFVFIQIVGIFFGFLWGFVGKESKKAYKYIKGFANADEFEAYYDRQKEIVELKANEKLTALQQKMSNYIGGNSINSDESDTMQNASARTFAAYVTLKSWEHTAKKRQEAQAKTEQKRVEAEQKYQHEVIKNKANLKSAELAKAPNIQTKADENPNQAEISSKEVTQDDLAKKRRIIEIKKELKALKKSGGDEARELELEEELLDLED